MTIAVFHSKGGVCKTTTVVNLAALWRTRNPLVLDTDYQQATTRYPGSLKGLDVRYPDASEVPGMVGQGTAIVDCPPFPDYARQILRVADAIVIPFATEYGPYQEVRECYAEIEDLFPGKGRVLLARHYDTREDSRKWRAEAAKAMRMFSTVIPYRTIVDKASSRGMSALDYAPASDVARRIRSLGAELEELISNGDN